MKFSKVSNPLSRVRNRTRSVKITSTCAWIDKPCWTDSSREIFRQDWVWKNGRKNVSHSRGDNADYHLSDVVLFTLVGMIGGATSMAKVNTVWACRI